MTSVRWGNPMGLCGIIERLSGTTSGTYRPAQWFRDWAGGGTTTAGVTVNEGTALNYSAVWAATRVISETVAIISCILYRRIPSGGKEKADAHPLYRLLHDQPNPEMDKVTFFDTMTASLVNRGNAYAEIQRTGDGRLFALWPIHASRVEPRRSADGILFYHVTDPTGGGGDDVPAENIFHVVGPVSDQGILGRGVIQQARESIGMGLATEQFGAAFFANGARPSGVLKYPGQLDEKTYNRIVEAFNRKHGGATNTGKVALLEHGIDWVAASITPEDAQFLDTRVFNVNEIARWYRLPPHKLAELSHATFSNIEQENISFIQDGILPWLVRYEKAIGRQLLTEEEKGEYYAEFNADTILRGDAKSRNEAYAIQFTNGALTENEWRSAENRNPVPGELGDRYFVPANLMPIDKIDDEPEPAPQAPAGAMPPDDEENMPEEMPEDMPPEAPKKMGAAAKQELEIVGRMLRKDAIGMRWPRSLAEFLDRLEEFYPDNLANAASLASRLKAAKTPGSAAAAVVQETVARMLRKEAAAALRWSHRPAEFLDRLEEFYPDHLVAFAAALTLPLAAQLEAAGIHGNPAMMAEGIAKELVEESKALLLKACECKPAELKDSIARCVADWPARAERIGGTHADPQS